MSKDKTVVIDGVAEWLYLIKRFGMSPKEALATMEKHEQDVASVLVYLEELLGAYTLNHFDIPSESDVKSWWLERRNVGDCKKAYDLGHSCRENKNECDKGE